MNKYLETELEGLVGLIKHQVKERSRVGRVPRPCNEPKPEREVK